MEKKATCRECKAEKTLEEFYVTPQGKVCPWCKTCQGKRRSTNYYRYKAEGKSCGQEDRSESYTFGNLICY